MERSRIHLLSCALLLAVLLFTTSAASEPVVDDALSSLEAATAGYVDPSFGRPAWSNDLFDEAVLLQEESRGEEEGQRVTIRETIWVHQARPTQAVASSRVISAPEEQEEPANILTTLGRLKPLFDYGIQHPLRFGYQYLLPSLFSLLRSSTLFLLRSSYALTSFLLLSLLAPLLSPLLSFTLLLLTPLRTSYHLLLALSPLWISLLGALALGALLGSVAGMATGASTRAWIEGVGEGEVWSFVRGLARGAMGDKREVFGGVGRKIGARVERVEKGKEREMGGDEGWFEAPREERRGMEGEEEWGSEGSERTGSSRTEIFGGREGKSGWRVRGAYA